jgi:hypothetical protein
MLVSGKETQNSSSSDITILLPTSAIKDLKKTEFAVGTLQDKGLMSLTNCLQTNKQTKRSVPLYSKLKKNNWRDVKELACITGPPRRYNEHTTSWFLTPVEDVEGHFHAARQSAPDIMPTVRRS